MRNGITNKLSPTFYEIEFYKNQQSLIKMVLQISRH